MSAPRPFTHSSLTPSFPDSPCCFPSGLVATHLVLKDQPSWESGGLILHSAAIDVEWNPILRIQARELRGMICDVA